MRITKRKGKTGVKLLYVSNVCRELYILFIPFHFFHHIRKGFMLVSVKTLMDCVHFVNQEVFEPLHMVLSASLDLPKNF